MDNTAIIIAIVSLIGSLATGFYNIRIQILKSKEEEPVRDASVSRALSEASEIIAKQYGELLDRVKRDFHEKLLEMKAEMEELKKEINERDKTIEHLELENDRLKARVAELETELKSWKELRRPTGTTQPLKTNNG